MANIVEEDNIRQPPHYREGGAPRSLPPTPPDRGRGAIAC